MSELSLDQTLSDTASRVAVTERLTIGGLSDRGKQRRDNEDALLVDALGLLCLVADGMGGAAAGATASHIAVRELRAAFATRPGVEPAEALVQAVTAANRAIWEYAEAHPDKRGMGCTMTAAFVRGDQATLAQVGDTRAYLIRASTVQQITRDHSWVAQQVALGVLTREQARVHPRRNVITRALGPSPSVEVDVYRQQLQPEDVLLLCSDGLHGLVEDAELGSIARQRDPATAVDRLVALANERGGPDNVTVAIVRVEPSRVATAASQPLTSGTQRPPVRLDWRLGVVGALLVGAALGIAVDRFGMGARGQTISEPTPTVAVTSTVVPVPVVTADSRPTATVATPAGETGPSLPNQSSTPVPASH